MTNHQWTKADPKWCRIETVVHGVTIGEAIRKVVANRGSAGVDRVTVQELEDYWKQHGETIRQKIRNLHSITCETSRYSQTQWWYKNARHSDSNRSGDPTGVGDRAQSDV